VGIDGSTGARFVKNTLVGVNTNISTLNNRVRAAINFVNNLQAANGCEVEGNYISDAKTGVWLKGTGSGASGNSYRCIITNNVFDTMGTGAGTGMAQYGAIWIDAGSTNNVVTGNTQVGGTPLITGASSVNALDQMAATTIKGNATAGWALGQDLTGTQITAMLDTFTFNTKGLTPASGGGANTYLRADGTWAPAIALGAEWGGITGKPITLSGYGITDGQSTAVKGLANGYAGLDATGKVPTDQLPASTSFSGAFADLTGKPTTLAGYGITDGGAGGTASGGQDLPWLTPVSGESMMTTICSSGGTATLVCVAKELRLFPFTPRVDTPIAGLCFNVLTGMAAGSGKIAIYRSDANGRPDTLLLETASVDMSATGIKTVAVSQTLLKGQTYWLGLRSSANPTIAAWAAGATPDVNGGAPSTTARKTVFRQITYSSPAPANWGWSSAEIGPGAAPAIWLVA
jgi:hypothetical protein